MILLEINNAGQLRRAILTVLLLLFLAWSLAGLPAAAGERSPKKVSLMPLWSPQAQFAGYYVALDKGIYADHGIDLTILKGGPEQSPETTLLSGEADFAVLWLTTALKHRAAGRKLVNVAQIIQRSAMMLIARKDSGIATPADLEGRKVGLWTGDLVIPPRALFAKYGVEVREVPQSYTVNLFLRGGIDVTSAMWYNEYHLILNSGIDPEELNVISLHEHGMNFPEDGLYTLEATLRRDPELTDAFVRASMEGWRYAFAHPDEALDVVLGHMRAAKVPANRMHQKWMLERMRDLILSGDLPDSLGRLEEADYREVGRSLLAAGLIPEIPDYTQFSRSSHAGP